jgi:hypothetical protein
LKLVEENDEIVPYFMMFALNDPGSSSMFDAYGNLSNYLYVNYPSWRGARMELAFLYTRLGNPDALLDRDGVSLDPRPAPAAGKRENTTETYDIGYLTFEKMPDGNYYYTMQPPIWAFMNPERGEGVYYQPSWQPGDSGSITASYSRDGGANYDVALFLHGTDETYANHVGFTLTQNGYSIMPSWGKVVAEKVLATMDILPFRGPEEDSFMVETRGFVPGETVSLYQSYTESTQLANEQPISSKPANDEGIVFFDVTLDKESIPAGTEVIWYQARGQSSGKETSPDSVSISDSTSEPTPTPQPTSILEPTPVSNNDRELVYLPLVER